MNFLADNIYFNFFSIASLIPAVFLGGLAFIFIRIKNKSRQGKQFMVSYILTGIFFFGYFLSASIYHPFSAFHRWITVGTVMYGLLNISLIAYYYPDERGARFSKIYQTFSYIFIPIIVLFFYYTTLNSQKVFHFYGHYWDFKTDSLGKIISLILILYMFMSLLFGIWRAFANKGKMKIYGFIMGFILFVGFLIPGITNFLSRDGLMDRGTYQISQDLANIFTFFIATLLYINTTKDRSNFMTKILGVSLATLLLVFQFIAYFSLQDQDKAFDAMNFYKTKYSIETKNYDKNIKYIISNSSLTNDNSAKIEFVKDKKKLNINFTPAVYEMKNTLLFEKIANTESKDFYENIKKLLTQSHYYFSGYNKGIQQFTEKNKDKKNLKVLLIKYINSITRPVLFTKTKVSQLKEKDFKQKVITFMKKSRVPFMHESIKAHIQKSTKNGKELKKDILKFLSPLQSHTVRRYRKNADDSLHYVSFMHADVKSNIIYEAGYPYREYRKFIHKASVKYLVILLIMVAVILIGFPFFFIGALIKPIQDLLKGLRQINSGNLSVQIPVHVADEFGTMAKTFNSMAVTIKDATENLEDTVATRTEELQSTMEELEAMNDVLIKTRDALWGEMELAKKIQTVLVPAKPSIAGYEIAVSMTPADEVGGDYYDVIQVENMDWIIIGDVSGHGVPAGLIMMMVQTAIQVILKRHPDIEPSELLEIINTTISSNISKLGEDKYMTITVFATHTNGEFLFSGLHQDIYIYRQDKKELETIETKGMWIGIVDDLKGMVENDKLALHSGDTMLLFSDGITEALDEDGNMYSEEKLSSILQELGEESPEFIKSKILKSLEKYTCNDDVTFVILKRK